MIAQQFTQPATTSNQKRGERQSAGAAQALVVTVRLVFNYRESGIEATK